MADYHSAPPLLHLQPMFLSSPSLIRPFFFLSFFFLLLGNLSLSISFVSWSFFDRRQSLCYVCFLYNSLYLHVCIGLSFLKKPISGLVRFWAFWARLLMIITRLSCLWILKVKLVIGSPKTGTSRSNRCR